MIIRFCAGILLVLFCHGCVLSHRYDATTCSCIAYLKNLDASVMISDGCDTIAALKMQVDSQFWRDPCATKMPHLPLRKNEAYKFSATIRLVFDLTDDLSSFSGEL